MVERWLLSADRKCGTNLILYHGNARPAASKLRVTRSGEKAFLSQNDADVILDRIFSFCDYGEIVQVGQTCKRLKELSDRTLDHCAKKVLLEAGLRNPLVRDYDLLAMMPRFDEVIVKETIQCNWHGAQGQADDLITFLSQEFAYIHAKDPDRFLPHYEPSYNYPMIMSIDEEFARDKAYDILLSGKLLSVEYCGWYWDLQIKTFPQSAQAPSHGSSLQAAFRFFQAAIDKDLDEFGDSECPSTLKFPGHDAMCLLRKAIPETIHFSQVSKQYGYDKNGSLSEISEQRIDIKHSIMFMAQLDGIEKKVQYDWSFSTEFARP